MKFSTTPRNALIHKTDVLFVYPNRIQTKHFLLLYDWLNVFRVLGCDWMSCETVYDEPIMTKEAGFMEYV